MALKSISVWGTLRKFIVVQELKCGSKFFASLLMNLAVNAIPVERCTVFDNI